MAEKRYFWLRLYDDFFTSKRIKKLRSIAGGDTYTIIYLKMQLKALKTDGYLYFDGVMDDFAEELALDIDENPDNVKVTINFLLSNGLLETNDGEQYKLPYLDKCIGSENASTQRVRDYRTRQKALQCNATVTEVKRVGNAEIDIEKEKDIDKDIYGEAQNVLLTKEEYQKIKDKGLTELIEELSLYMASKKKAYADHYATILAWAKRREQEKKTESGTDSKNQFNRFKQRDDYDFDALEKKLIKN